MRRALKWVGGILAVLILLPLLLVGGLLLGANTGPGQRAIERLATRLVPGLTIEGLRGPIPGSPGFSRLTMADSKGPWLLVEHGRIDLGLGALLNRELLIERVAADRVALLRLPESSPDEPEPQPEEQGPLIPTLPELPVAIRLRQLDIARIEIPRELVAATQEEAAPGGDFALSAQGDASFVAAALEAQLQLHRLGQPGELTLEAGLDPKSALKLNLRVQEPAGGVLATAIGAPDNPADLSLSLDGPASGAALRAQGSIGEAARFAAQGTVAMNPDRSARIALEGDAAVPTLLPPPAARLEFAIDASQGTAGDLRLARLWLRAPGGEISAEGSMELLTVQGRVAASTALAPLVPEVVGWESIALDGSIANGQDFRLRLTPDGLRLPAPADAALGPAPVVEYAGTISRIDSLTVDGAATRLEGSGTFGEQLDLTLHLSAPEVSRISPQVAGPLDLRATVRGPAANPAVTAHLSSPGLTVSGRRLEAPELEVETPAVMGLAGNARLTAQAEGLPVSLSLRAAAEGDLVRLAEAQGQFGPIDVTADGSFNTTTSLFDGHARLKSENLAPLSALAGQPVAGRLELNATLTPQEERQGIDARLQVQQLQAAGQTIGAELTLRGTDAALDFAANAKLPMASANGRGRFSRGNNGMRFDLAALDVTQGQYGIRLAAPGSILLPPSGAVEIPGLRLTARPAGNITLSGRWGPERADLRLALAALPLSVANLFVPQPQFGGTVVGEARITGPTSAPEVKAVINGTGLTVTAPWSRGWPAATLRMEATRNGAGAIRADASLRAGNLANLTAQASLPQGPATEAPLSASVKGTVDLAPALAPTLGGGANQVNGRIVLDASAGGTLGAPQLGGTVDLANGTVRNPLYGLRLTNITGRLRAQGQQILLERLNARAGQGSINAQGSLEPFAAGIPIDITVTARNAQPLQSELVTLLTDADLRFTGPLQVTPALGGTILLRRAVINIPQQLPGGGVVTLGDVQERGGPNTRSTRPTPRRNAAPPAPALEATPAAPVALDLRVEAPQSILVRGRGLDAEMGGSVHIGGTAANPSPDGTFKLRRGTFQLLERRLTFSYGALVFDGAGLLPSLDFAATSTVQGVMITVTITGQPSAPVIKFTSDPELPQDEVLARLLFGRSVDKLSPFEIAQLAASVAGTAGVLPGSGGGGFFSRLAERLGLDRLGIGSTDDNGTGSASNSTLEAGGYIGQGVYVGVEQGLEGGPRVEVDVELTPRLKLESSTGGEAGQKVGLSYEVEY
ncbi:translocation/assembly module TamB domain-containing protein [Roseomonas marmotae]|uniref:Translocation/assembly module TamB domain-containing protein n=1 Tax=Roseomonas marmotae TaxID=2768161 RepID=A0ABS3KA20_9PROT|nr:translocation/assembly module TamB domain-containing protein [Roseomonas marmotae]MBO1074295.1 translocation/assembly module TamB domain-containing protein [Roseomonas marmotae]QTI78049.1 translocation/assembly module TamB domain-containing protein [Roseomonas marmotae]